MTAFTDEQLLMLEQLAYLNENIEEAAGLKDHSPNGQIAGIKSGDSVADLMYYYDQTAIDELRSNGNNSISSEMTGDELAALMEAIKSDEEIMSLKLQVKDDDKGAYCFTDSNGEAIVIFRGTTTGDEWFDNFTGLGTSDTDIQRETLDFIEDLPYEGITVVGHSKGGNKAMYTAILSDKVSRAISMDGQGFSQEFLHKYEEEILRNAGKITNYSLDADFVHILLYQVGRQIYIDGNDYVDKAKNHCPLNLFWFVQDENGTWHIDRNEDGSIRLHVTSENEGMTYLHGFTIFILENCPIEDRVIIGEYLGHIMACFMRPAGKSGAYSFTGENGIIYDSNNITEYIFSHTDELGLVIAYLMKYFDTYNLSEEQMWALIRAMGWEDIIRMFEAAIAAFSAAFPVVAKALGITGLSILAILRLIMANIVDGKRDPMIEQLLSWINEWLSGKLGVQLNLDRLWRSIEESYTAIGDVDASTGKLNTIESESKTFDYSQKTYDKLLTVLNRVDSYTSGSISGWNRVYSSEKWYNDLSISIFVNGIESYGERIQEINADCRDQINEIFENVWKIDREKASQMAQHREQIENVRIILDNLRGAIG